MSASTLAGLQPAPVWTLFEAISRVPRCSGKEQHIRAWVREWAAARGIPWREDSVGNLLLRQEADPGWGGVPTLVLQAHLDMVCVRRPGAAVDPEKDPLELRVEGNVVRAEGTTLGADNGVGVAMCLAALSDRSRPRGPIEALFTVDEECGFSGALGLKPGFFTGKYLLNLDSEELGVITIGTAGGEYTDYTLKAPRMAAPGDDWRRVQLAVDGLAGGHSGIDIHRGRLNALKVVLEALACVEQLRPEPVWRLEHLEGGTATNAIPPSAGLALLVPRTDAARAFAALARWREANLSRLLAVEPGLRVHLADHGSAAGLRAYSPEDSRRLAHLLAAVPHGPLAWSRTIPGLVETSNNLARVRCRDEAVEVNLSCRSSVDEELLALSGRLKALGETHGAEVRQHSRYPGWAAEPDSPFLEVVRRCYQEASGAAVHLKAFHAGLECGVFKGLDPALQIASIGPVIRGVHTPEEEVEVASVALIWSVLRRIVQSMRDVGGGAKREGQEP